MEWKNNNPGRLSGAPLRPSREKTQSAKTAPSPAPAARARARPASFRMSASLHSRRRLFIGYAETRMEATVPPPEPPVVQTSLLLDVRLHRALL